MPLDLSNPKTLADAGLSMQLQTMHGQGLVPAGAGNHLKLDILQGASKSIVQAARLMKKAASQFSDDDPCKVLWHGHVTHSHAMGITFHCDPESWGEITPFEYLSEIFPQYDFDTHHPVASSVGTGLDMILTQACNPCVYGLARWVFCSDHE